MPPSYSIMIHGGAGELDRVSNNDDAIPYLESINTILEYGKELLSKGDSALDAVEKCANLLENNPLFNAGRGSALNAQGRVEMDAAIMDGNNLNAGAVAGIHGIANPVSLARLVLSESEHIMLTGEGAMQFAGLHGMEIMPDDYFITEARLKQYERAHKANCIALADDIDDSHDTRHGTIGAVARDKSGFLAAATSTGGIVNKQFGRVGDSPIIGAGVFADNTTCAVSATGYGEDFMRTVLAKHISNLVEFKKIDATSAVKQGIKYLANKIKGRGGVIVIDKDGKCASGFTTKTMIHGWCEYGGRINCTYNHSVSNFNK